MPRAILFDMDGVLISSRDAWFETLVAIAARRGASPIERAAFDASFGQGVTADIERFFPMLTAEELEHEYDRTFPEMLEHVVVMRGAREVTEALRARDLPTAVVTNTPPGLARTILARVGLDAGPCFGATRELAEKPAPDLVLAACASLSVAPEHALLVGDSAYDREAARTAGARFAGLGIEGETTIASLDELLVLDRLASRLTETR